MEAHRPNAGWENPGSAADATPAPILRASNLIKSFGAHVAVNGVSLELAPGEVMTLLGPSGCGKTTTLRILAGLERATTGEIWGPDGRILASPKLFVPPHQRNIGMVFQSYAIWPHMTVYENVAYPLRLRKLAADKIDRRVRSVLDTVGLAGFEARPAPLLSGGQQQRVALARALAGEPDLLLLDEPFSNLDTGLRERMRFEMSELQRKFGLSIILVTHDQIEALSLSDRIVVMNEGRIEQTGAPKELYSRPATPFVRDFLGKTVILKGSVLAQLAQGRVTFAIADYPGPPVEAQGTQVDSADPQGDVRLAIRPEDITARPFHAASAVGPNWVRGTIRSLLFVGSTSEARIALAGGQLLPIYLPQGEEWTEGSEVALFLPPEKTSVWRA